MKKLLSISLIGIITLSCSSVTKDWYNNDKAMYIKFAATMDSLIYTEVTPDSMNLAYFEGFSDELLFIHYFMASMGYGQIIYQYPELDEKYIKNMEYCIDMMLTPAVKAYDSDVWGEDPIEGVYNNTTKAHGAYLNYLNMALSLHNVVSKRSKYAKLNDLISLHIVKQLKKSQYSLIETYPDQYYPADISAALGSLGLYKQATGKQWKKVMWEATKDFDMLFRDSTGLVYHQIYITDELHYSEARGASTAFSAYFMSFVNMVIARRLFESIEINLYTEYPLLAGVREYKEGVDGGMDEDSGPIVLGLGTAATGFTLASTKTFKHKKMFNKIFSVSSKVGGAVNTDTTFMYKRGSYIGNSIMFAMLTAF